MLNSVTAATPKQGSKAHRQAATNPLGFTEIHESTIVEENELIVSERTASHLNKGLRQIIEEKKEAINQIEQRYSKTNHKAGIQNQPPKDQQRKGSQNRAFLN